MKTVTIKKKQLKQLKEDLAFYNRATRVSHSGLLNIKRKLDVFHNELEALRVAARNLSIDYEKEGRLGKLLAKISAIKKLAGEAKDEAQSIVDKMTNEEQENE